MLTFITSTALCASVFVPSMISTSEVHAQEIQVEATDTCNKQSQEGQNKQKDLNDQWNQLTEKQKADIYKSIKGTVDAQAKFLDKLVKYELITEEEAKMMKEEMYNRFNDMKKNDSLFQGKPKNNNQKPATESNSTES